MTTQATGFIGGGQLGYNWQSGNFIYGWEANIDGLTGQGDTTGLSAGFSGKGAKNKINWLNADRVRAGLALGDTQVYLTGVLSLAELRTLGLMLSPLPPSVSHASSLRARPGLAGRSVAASSTC